ncbi:hypothetical protein CAOG_03392 [Capsaspora owczarzaki ATCC 30864]|uniref:Uncharacterized protein n=1 Tax=Capsaspora owczarzaki (strain ATCC 30864) TaxID=595528 RepID=A0A0D2WN14_CAPO3|nr:hypothetical protein CAOG_03392 [Capsaspora owczarzaki ATCC 30864]KJE92415.1 hypothetical protein CAOG_003392 [Capsaspora owczarzaki ATCC 30864]|eukprot:XP_004364231.1 hypothetical protein CAOG_03392 [Capsaspora owczarzaki ATCC 30864]
MSVVTAGFTVSGGGASGAHTASVQQQPASSVSPLSHAHISSSHLELPKTHCLVTQVSYLGKVAKHCADKSYQSARAAAKSAIRSGQDPATLFLLAEQEDRTDNARRQDILLDEISTVHGVSCWRLHPKQLEKPDPACKLLSGQPQPPIDPNIFHINSDLPVEADENQHMLLGPARDMPRAVFETALSRLIEQSPSCMEMHVAPAGDPATLVEPMANLELGASSVPASASASSAAPLTLPALSDSVAMFLNGNLSEGPLDFIERDGLDSISCLLLDALDWTIFLPHISAAEKAVAYYIATRIVGQNTVELLSERSTLWWFVRDALTRHPTTDDREINVQACLIEHLDCLIGLGQGASAPLSKLVE